MKVKGREPKRGREDHERDILLGSRDTERETVREGAQGEQIERERAAIGRNDY